MHNDAVERLKDRRNSDPAIDKLLTKRGWTESMAIKMGYKGATCREFDKGACARGIMCEYAHGQADLIELRPPKCYQNLPGGGAIQRNNRASSASADAWRGAVSAYSPEVLQAMGFNPAINPSPAAPAIPTTANAKSPASAAAHLTMMAGAFGHNVMAGMGAAMTPSMLAAMGGAPGMLSAAMPTAGMAPSMGGYGIGMGAAMPTGVPGMPGVSSSMHGIGAVPGVPGMPGVSGMPGLPAAPGVPAVPGMPGMGPGLGVPGMAVGVGAGIGMPGMGNSTGAEIQPPGMGYMNLGIGGGYEEGLGMGVPAAFSRGSAPGSAAGAQ